MEGMKIKVRRGGMLKRVRKQELEKARSSWITQVVLCALVLQKQGTEAFSLRR